MLPCTEACALWPHLTDKNSRGTSSPAGRPLRQNSRGKYLDVIIFSFSSFKLFLELEPQIRDIIFKFYESKYASCLKLLDEMKVGLCFKTNKPIHVRRVRSPSLIKVTLVTAVWVTANTAESFKVESWSLSAAYSLHCPLRCHNDSESSRFFSISRLHQLNEWEPSLSAEFSVQVKMKQFVL